MEKLSVFHRKHPHRSVNVLGHRIRVRVVNDVEDDDTTELLGAFDSENETIYLLRDPKWRQVLLHEIIHAILHYSGHNEGLSIKKEESIVLALEHGLQPILEI